MDREEAIEKVRQMSLPKETMEILEALAPELKESEDERIRKWILEYLYDGLRKADEQFKGQFKTAIAYIEKQKEEEGYEAVPVESTLEYKLGFHAGKEAQWRPNDEQIHALKRTIRLSNFGCEKERRNALSSLLEQLRQLNSPSETHKQELFEKQKEQKRKFKVGDRVTNGEDVYIIDKIDKDCYWVKEHDCATIGECFYTIPFEYEDEWSIEQKSLTPEEKMKHPLYVEGFEAGKEVGRQYEKTFSEQKPAEWSEEDERMLESIIWHIRNSVNLGDIEHTAGQLENWLKSLRPSWKPSEEQMDSLRDTIIQTKGYSYSMYLPELYEQLKKLINK